MNDTEKLLKEAIDHTVALKSCLNTLKQSSDITEFFSLPILDMLVTGAAFLDTNLTKLYTQYSIRAHSKRQ